MLEKARLLILDGIGLALAASREDFAMRALRAIRTFGSGEEASVIGMPVRLPAVNAPLLNGMMIHAFDFDDTHHPLVIHNSSVVVPAALAAAELTNASGRDFVEACALGFEVSLRVARGTAVHAMHGRGFHPTAVCGVFGGAAAAGRLLGLSHQQLTYAFGLAGSQGSGNMEWQSDGSWSKRFQPGWAAHGALVGVHLAAQGYTAPRTALEGPRGFWATHVGLENIELQEAIRDLGEDWEIDRVEFKPYPCAGALQATVRAAIMLRNRHRITANSIDEIEDVECRLRMGDREAESGQERVFSVQRPAGDYGAHFSTPFVAAVGLLRGRLALADFAPDALNDPDILRLTAKMHREDDPNHGRPKYASGHIIIRMRDGRVLEERQHIHPGHVENPVTPTEVQEKFLYNAARVVGDPEAKALSERLVALDSEPSMRTIADALRYEALATAPAT